MQACRPPAARLQAACCTPIQAAAAAAAHQAQPPLATLRRRLPPQHEMLLTNGILTNEVLRWKAIGAAVWLAAITLAAAAAWSVAAHPAALLSPLRLLGGLFSPGGWLAAAALVVAQAPAFAAQAGALRAVEPRPAQPHRLLLRLPRPAAGAALVLSKLAARCSSVAGAARTAAWLALHALSAVLFLSMDAATRTAAPSGEAPMLGEVPSPPFFAASAAAGRVCFWCIAEGGYRPPVLLLPCWVYALQAPPGRCSMACGSPPPTWRTGPTGAQLYLGSLPRQLSGSAVSAAPAHAAPH